MVMKILQKKNNCKIDEDDINVSERRVGRAQKKYQEPSFFRI
jgi:hypothetical protein